MFLLIAVLVSLRTANAAAPYPPSTVITGMTIDWSTKDRRASGSDNWPITWADDGHQYTAWGDGEGFNSGNTRVSLGVARVEGDWDDYVGYDVWGGEASDYPAQFEGKSYGILCVDGVLYMWVGPGSGTESYAEARLCRSTNHGATWTQASWAFPGSDGVIMPTILNFGKNYAGARDGYVYHYFVEKKTSAWEVHRPGEITLARVPKDQMMTRSAYQFVAGFDASQNPIWSADIDDRIPIFEDPAGAGIEVSVGYNSGLERYLLITEHTATHQGRMGIFDAPEPWGPWTTVSYTESFAGGDTFFYNFSNKWQSADGKDVTLIYTGVGSEDAWHSVRARFTTSSAGGGDGTGLLGSYYDDEAFTAHVADRVDATVDFVWGTSAPFPPMGTNSFSVRWTGQVRADFTEPYTFITTTNDGVRLWIDGQLVIDEWGEQATTEHSGTVDLVAGELVDVRMEYHDVVSGAVARLEWQSARRTREVIPADNLYPPSSAVGVGDPGAPPAMALRLAVPSPLLRTSVVRFASPEAGWARLALYDAGGRRRGVLFEGLLGAGVERSVDLDPEAMASGVYFVTFESKAARRTERIVVMP